LAFLICSEKAYSLIPLNVLFYVEVTLGTTDNKKLPAIYGDMNKQDFLLKASIDPNWNVGDANGLSPPAEAVEALSQISDI
jgi:hypothetical protein